MLDSKEALRDLLYPEYWKTSVTRKTNDGSAMKCNAPFDLETGMVLQGDELAAAISTERVAFCSNEVDERDVFCPRCGARIKADPLPVRDAFQGVVDGPELLTKCGRKPSLWPFVLMLVVSLVAVVGVLILICRGKMHHYQYGGYAFLIGFTSWLIHSIVTVFGGESQRDLAEAQDGKPYAQYNIGVRIVRREIELEDEDSSCPAVQAYKYFMKAAAADYKPAQYNVAVCLERGIGCDCNSERAIEWYRRAAEGGFALAIRRLNEMDV